MWLNKDNYSCLSGEKVFWFCCLDVDRRVKFCFVEYDTDTAAQKAVSAENGRDFQGTSLSTNHFISFHRLAANDWHVSVEF